MDHRGFDTVEEMNEYMINRWNSRVRRNDEVVILGDLCISKKAEDTNEILSRLKGKKGLIIGNHDNYLADKNFNTNAFQWVESYKELNDNKRKVVLSHYPIMCYNGQYRRAEDGTAKTYMLYGHVHNTYDEFVINEFQRQIRKYKRSIYGVTEEVEIPCQMINCFCMFSDYVPLTLDEWIELDKKRREELSIKGSDDA
jgi:calcineurin-like phosphoesterase family protein